MPSTDQRAAPPSAALNALDALDALHAGGPVGGAAPLPTGFDPLDDVLNGGLRPGDLAVLGGKPGQGKTTVALQWARHAAARGRSTVFACYEHGPADLVGRLLGAELGQLVGDRDGDDELRLETLRQRLRAMVTGAEAPADVIASDPLLVEAERRMRSYGDRLLLVPASGALTDVEALGRLVDAFGAGALFVDYLQKVPVVGGGTDRSARVAEALKELALRRSVTVVAVAAADHAGLVDRRLHLHHLRGSTALAYEADVAVLLNEKLGIVSKLHLAYDTTRAHEFREHLVFSIEKNRLGLADVHLEFRKDFANHRVEPCGRWVSERLWDEGSPEE